MWIELKSPLLRDGKKIAAGKQIELPDDEAMALIRARAAVGCNPAQPKAPKKDKQ